MGAAFDVNGSSLLPEQMCLPRTNRGAHGIEDELWSLCYPMRDGHDAELTSRVNVVLSVLNDDLPFVFRIPTWSNN